ncbi:FIG01132818: hypothetical protein [hydrothermal vent metagenome]|uniref:N-acyl-D-glucosamine 2-epimerase n=1 Tax=hydrothermal vent metagenome TaxID=652676 RepID=A0A3B0ZE82_9ZZZZ
MVTNAEDVIHSRETAFPVNHINVSYSDRFSGYLTGFDQEKSTFGIVVSDGKQYEFVLTQNATCKVVRNSCEDYRDSTEHIHEMLSQNGRYISVYGIAYPQNGGYIIEAKDITVFSGLEERNEYRFEEADWWCDQIKMFGNFQLHAQFGDTGSYNFKNYHTCVSGSSRTHVNWQEIDTLSRFLYGIATAYLMTGEEHFLRAVREGILYQREHMRIETDDGKYVYWYHAVKENYAGHKVLPSLFGDDYGSIPLYEQIYALAGLVQYYRITNDGEVLLDIEKTIAFMNEYYRDNGPDKGYYSHIDPVTFSPHEETLGGNRSRKNWNSVGDHMPAYLESLYLATGHEEHLDMIRYVADLVFKHFPDFKKSPFVQEKFHGDWSHDYEWGWQKNRGVVGHNLKIAWCMTRFNHLLKDPKYLELAKTIAGTIPEVGYDSTRGGWYDVMERSKPDGRDLYSFAWHDRKAWWQQEQALLAYMVLYGTTKDDVFLKYARETAAFWNMAFLDHDDGEVHFAVLADGTPYLVGTESTKGSHSKGAYHSFELCYFACLYNNLLHVNEPVDLYFSPNNCIPPSKRPGRWEGNKSFRVQPISFPTNKVSIDKVAINGQPYEAFKADEMIVFLPNRDDDYVMKVTYKTV